MFFFLSSKGRKKKIQLSYFLSATCSSLAVFSPGREGEEDEAHGGAHEGDRTVAAQHQTAAQREGRSAEGSGQCTEILQQKHSETSLTYSITKLKYLK